VPLAEGDRPDGDQGVHVVLRDELADAPAVPPQATAMAATLSARSSPNGAA